MTRPREVILTGDGRVEHLIKLGVTYAPHGGVAEITVYNLHGGTLSAGEAMFHSSVGAELADALIAALVPVLEARNANWHHTWRPAPNPNRRDDMDG